MDNTDTPRTDAPPADTAPANALSLSLLSERFVALCQRLGAPDTALAKTVFSELVSAYGEAHRHYHNREHIAEVLLCLDRAKASGMFSLSPREFDGIELALWFHDAVYDVRARDNEEKSAQKLLAAAQHLSLTPDAAQKAAGLVRMTAQHTTAATEQEKVMADCDIAILGAAPEVFGRYDRNIRKEYHHVPDEVFYPARGKILKTFAAERPLFKTEFFRQRHEEQALENLAAAIRTCESRPAKGAPAPARAR